MRTRARRLQPLLRVPHAGRLSIALFLALAWATLPWARGMIHSLDIQQDTRSVFKIESFGFEEGGVMNLTVSDFNMVHTHNGRHRAGFLMKRADTESSAHEDLESTLESHKCILDTAGPQDLLLDVSDPASWPHAAASKVVGAGQKGLYSLMFSTCPPPAEEEEHGAPADGQEHKVSGVLGTPAVSFRVRAVFFNVRAGKGGAGAGRRDYLSAGDRPLPTLFFCFFVLFALSLVLWVRHLRRNPTQVHHVHHMMMVLLVFKTLAMLFESIRYHYLRVSGAAEAWSIVYYIFAFLKGITLFVVILLIGTGWSLVKPFLNVREKRTIVVVLSLQVVNNVALVVLEETAPGSVYWLTWRDVLHVVDIMCCAVVLFPIIWSIRHLREAVQADGKAEHTIRRLDMFRHFYVMVFSYIYFTRIVVFLLTATLPFELLWLQELFAEGATLLFFLFTGWRFRPAADGESLYLAVDQDTNEEIFPSLTNRAPDAQDVELTAHPRGRVAV